MTIDATGQTGQVIAQHLQALPRGIDAILADYSDESVMISANGTARGLDELRAFFEGIFDALPAGWLDALKLVHQEVVDDVAFVVWNAEPYINYGADTFVVRDGKIARHTVSLLMPT